MRVLGFSLVLSVSLAAFAVPESTISHRPGDFIQSLQNNPAAGQQIYQEFCASCHAEHPTINVGAPRFRNIQDWKPYSSLSLETLLKIADTGIGHMPPRGGCFECSDENLKAAIIYMMGSDLGSGSKQK